MTAHETAERHAVASKHERRYAAAWWLQVLLLTFLSLPVVTWLTVRVAHHFAGGLEMAFAVALALGVANGIAIHRWVHPLLYGWTDWTPYQTPIEAQFQIGDLYFPTFKSAALHGAETCWVLDTPAWKQALPWAKVLIRRDARSRMRAVINTPKRYEL